MKNKQHTHAVFYHANCMDGILSAQAYKEQLTKHSALATVVLIPLTYGQYGDVSPILEYLRASCVTFMDVTPDVDSIVRAAQTLRAINEDSIDVQFIDHHPKADEVIAKASEEMQKIPNCRALVSFSSVLSACGLVVVRAEASTFTPVVSNVLRVASNYDLWHHDGRIDSPETRLALVFYENYRSIKQELNTAYEGFVASLDSGAQAGLGHLDTMQTLLSKVYEEVVDIYTNTSRGDELVSELKTNILAQEVKLSVIDVTTKELGVMSFLVGDFDPEIRNETSSFVREKDKQVAAFFQYRDIGSGLKFSVRQGSEIKYMPFNESVSSLHFDCNDFSRTSFGGGGHVGAGAFTMTGDHLGVSSENATDTLIATAVMQGIVKWFMKIGITITGYKLKNTTWQAWCGTDGDNYRETNDIDLL